jgi:ABC-2 type transport system permease protein
MSTSSSNTIPETVPVATTATLPTTRPFFWLVKREIWEHGSVYIAPLAVAGLVLFGFVISLFSLARHEKEIRETLTPDSFAAVAVLPYDIAAVAVIVVSVIVGSFYALSALYNERRERSILFWKSLPVSNTTTVLSKAFVPMVVIPTIAFGAVVVLHLSMLVLNLAGRAMAGTNAGELLANVPLFQMDVALLYGLLALALWHAPIYAWFLFVSGWAKKAPFLWGVLPPLALIVVERIAFGTEYVGHLIDYRVSGAVDVAFSKPILLPMRALHEHVMKNPAAYGTHHATGGVPVFGIAQIDLAGFLSTPGLWAGLIVAAAFLAAAVWVRRTREAI